MTKDNKDLKYVEQIKSQTWTPETREVRYIETEDLYPDLGYEDVSSSKGYGPCFEYNCRCNKQQLLDQIVQLQRKVANAPDSASFNLTISISQARLWNFHFKESGSSRFDTLYMSSIEEARNTLSKLERGSLWVVNASNMGSTKPATHKKGEIEGRIRDYIRQYERGQSINENITIYN